MTRPTGLLRNIVEIARRFREFVIARGQDDRAVDADKCHGMKRKGISDRSSPLGPRDDAAVGAPRARRSRATPALRAPRPVYPRTPGGSIRRAGGWCQGQTGVTWCGGVCRRRQGPRRAGESAAGERWRRRTRRSETVRRLIILGVKEDGAKYDTLCWSRLNHAPPTPLRVAATPERLTWHSWQRHYGRTITWWRVSGASGRG